jgi:hypothetical protein
MAGPAAPFHRTQEREQQEHAQVGSLGGKQR